VELHRQPQPLPDEVVKKLCGGYGRRIFPRSFHGAKSGESSFYSHSKLGKQPCSANLFLYCVTGEWRSYTIQKHFIRKHQISKSRGGQSLPAHLPTPMALVLLKMKRSPNIDQCFSRWAELPPWGRFWEW